MFKPNRLPSGYTELTYIESTGTQYINTHIKPTSNTQLFVDYQVIKLPSDVGESSTPFGSRIGWQNNMFEILDSVNASRDTHYAYGNANHAFNIGSRVGIRTQVNADKNVWTSKQIGNYTFSTSSFSCVNDMYLFRGNNNSGQMTYSDGQLRMYSFWCKDGSTEINLVPCINPQDEVGMYDLVSQQFFGNSGIGSFIAGDIQEFQEVEYIESSGTQYIDAEIKVNSDLDFEFEFEPIGTQTNAWRGFFGSRDSASSTNNITAWWEQNTTNFYLSYSSSDILFRKTITQYQKYLIEKHGDNFYVNNELVTSEHRTITDGTRNIYLFKNNTGDADYGCTPIKLYSACFYDRTTKVRDFIPALSVDGTVGLFDKVSQRLFTNQGTGVFTYEYIIDETYLTPPTNVVGIKYYRAVVQVSVDGVTVEVISNPAVIEVQNKLHFITQPEDIYTTQGSTATFTAVAVYEEGGPITYHWQKSKDRIHWRHAETEDAKLNSFLLSGSFVPGVKIGVFSSSGSYSFVAKESDNGLYFRCVAKSGTETAVSNTVSLTVI